MKTSFIFIFKRRLQDEYIRLNNTSSEYILKTSSRHLGQDQYIRLGHTSLRRFQDVFKTSGKSAFKTSSRRLGKTSCKNVFETSPRHLQDVLKRSLQDVFKMYHQVKLFLLTRLLDVSNMFPRRNARTVIYRRICLGHTFEKFMVSVKTLQE